MIKIFTSYLIFILASWSLSARNSGETEITTDEGIEVFQNEKFYLLKKNVQIISDTFSLSGDEVKVFFNKDLYDITTIYADGKVILNADANGINAIGNSMEIYLIDEKIITNLICYDDENYYDIYNLVILNLEEIKNKKLLLED